MNKKLISLLTSSLLIVSMTGCSKTVTSLDDLGGMPTYNDNREEERTEDYTIKQEQQLPDGEPYIASIRDATYGMVDHSNNVSYDLSFKEILDHHYGISSYEWELIEYIDDDNYTVIAYANDEKYVMFKTDSTQVITCIEMATDNVVYKNTQAEDKFYNDYVLTAWEPIKNRLIEEKKKEQSNNKSNSNKKNNTIQGTCIYCDGPLKDSDKKSVCQDCLNDPQFGGHMESTAPYGRCPSCNAAHASDRPNSIQGGYCDDCFARIKQEDYNEKHKYGDCVDCGVYLSKGEANSYGGRCAYCYAKYYDSSYDGSTMGNCERCGDKVDMRYTNDGWGYNHLCSDCTGELQAEESADGWTPWAG